MGDQRKHPLRVLAAILGRRPPVQGVGVLRGVFARQRAPQPPARGGFGAGHVRLIDPRHRWEG